MLIIGELAMGYMEILWTAIFYKPKTVLKIKFILKSAKWEGHWKSPNQDMLVNWRSFSHCKPESLLNILSNSSALRHWGGRGLCRLIKLLCECVFKHLHLCGVHSFYSFGHFTFALHFTITKSWLNGKAHWALSAAFIIR